MLAELSKAFTRTGPDPDGDGEIAEGEEKEEDEARRKSGRAGERALLHCKHRLHLRSVAFAAWPRMFAPTVEALLHLAAEQRVLDPAVFADILEEAFAKVNVDDSGDDSRFEAFSRGSHGFFTLDVVRDFMARSREHFMRQRAMEGQKGLFGALGRHAVSLAPLYALQGHLLVHSVAHRPDLGASSDGLWRELVHFYEPWLRPLPRESMSQWVREMCPTSLLLPWRWQDKAGPKEMVDSFVSVVVFAFNNLACECCLACWVVW